MTGPGDADPFARIGRELDDNVRSLAVACKPVAGGWLAMTPSLPLVWTLNRLVLTELASFEDAAALADEHQAGLSCRHLIAPGDVAGPSLPGDFAAAGWRVDREVVMALGPTIPRPVDHRVVSEIDEAQMLELMRAWTLADHADISDDGLEQVLRYVALEGRRWNETRFGVIDDSDGAVALTKLRLGDGVAWVEDVYTSPDARRQGHARTLVTHATERARAHAPLVFILADDNDWPKFLYADVGFQPVGFLHQFHREVGAA